MPNSLTVTRTARGLYSQVNPLTEIPEGGLLEASNVVIDREGMISKRRGFNRFGQALTRVATSFFEYQDRLLYFDGTQLWFDNTGLGGWVAYSATFTDPESLLARMRGIQFRENFYFTSGTGIQKNDALATAPVQAGMPPGLDIDITLTGTGGGWFAPNTAVAYRIVWGRVDRNQLTLPGAPSTREVVTNPAVSATWTRAGTTATVTQNGHGYATGDLVEISGSSDILAVPNGTETITVLNANQYTFTSLDPQTSATWERTLGNTITVTQFSHGYENNISVIVTGSSDTTAVPNGTYTIVRPTTDTYAFTGGGGGTVNSGTLSAGAGSGTLSAGKKLNATLVTTIPDGILADDYYEVYRTDPSGAAADDPGDRCLLIQRKIVTAGDLASKTITYTDTTDSAFLGTDLYTNSEREGIQQANTRPPWAKDIAEFNEALYFASTMREEVVEFRLLTATGIDTNPTGGVDSITLTADSVAQTYSADTTEDIANRKWKSFENDTSVALPSQKVEKTAKSLVRCINRDPANTKFYAFYTAGITEAPGEIRIERRTLNTGQFFVTVNNSTFGAKWSPVLPTSGTGLASDNTRMKNGLYWSKFDQPESVPEGNMKPVGAEQFEILRILKLGSSLIILKEDGIFRGSGPPGEEPTVEELDPTIILTAPETARILDKAVWCLSSQGVVRITENGTEIISRPFEDELTTEIFQTDNYENTTHAVGYESARKYIVFGPGDGPSLGNTPTAGWVYNYLTRAWSRWEKRVGAAYVTRKEDKLYLAHGLDKYILQERKSTIGVFGTSGTDYQDEDLENTATVSTTTNTTDPYGNAVSQVTITGWIYFLPPAEGWGFSQLGSDTSIIAVTGGAGTYVLTLSKFDANYTTGTASLTVGIKSRVRWAPEEGESVALLKHFQSVHIYIGSEIEKDMVFRVGFRTDIPDSNAVTSEYFITDVRLRFLEHYPQNVIRVRPLPYTVQRCRALGLVFEHLYNEEPFNIQNVAYVYRPIGDRVSLAST